MFGEGKATTQYNGLATGWGQMADIETSAGRANWQEQMAQRCTPATKCEDARWQRNAQVVRADTMSYAARQDEARTQIINDRRYARQYAVLGLGRGQIRDLLSYQAIGNAIGTNASEMLLSTVNSALTAYGYYSNRQNAGHWGQGTRDMLDRGPTAPMGERPVLSQVSMPAQPRLSPVSPELLKVATPQFGKSNEWSDLASDLRKMEDRSGRY